MARSPQALKTQSLQLDPRCALQQVWLLGGEAADAEAAVRALPGLANGTDSVHVRQEDMLDSYRKELRDPMGVPSTGWIGVPTPPPYTLYRKELRDPMGVPSTGWVGAPTPHPHPIPYTPFVCLTAHVVCCPSPTP